MPNVEDVVGAYVKLRDEKDALKKEQSASLAPFNEKLKKLEGWLLKQMQAQGAKSVATPHGTCYQAKRTSAKIEDWDSIFGYVKENELWHFLERRVSKAALEEYLEANEELPPGVSMSHEVVVNVRRS